MLLQSMVPGIVPGAIEKSYKNSYVKHFLVASRRFLD